MILQVRNAATLAYVVLVARLLGLKNTESESNSRRPAMSMQAFLCSYPSLASFLLEHLTDAVTQTAASQATTPHPHLHPILLLFSNMQRSDGEAREGGVSSPGPAVAQFQAVIQQCLSMPSLAVRTLAARALAALCPAGGLPKAVAEQLDAVLDQPALLQQQRADAVHGALLAAHHMLLNAMPPCSTEENSSTLAVAAPLLEQRLWMLRQRLCPCAAVSREFVHVLEAFNAAQSASVHFHGEYMLPMNGKSKTTHGAAAKARLGVQTGAAQALMDCQCQLDRQQMPMQALWSQSMARISLTGTDIDLTTSLASTVYAVHSQEYCLRIEGYQWLSSENALQLDSKVQRKLADELWAAIGTEKNQVALAAALEAAVCFGGGLEMQEALDMSEREAFYRSEENHINREDALQHWLGYCAAGEKRLQHISSAGAKHGNDQNISQQVLKFTGVLLGQMLDGCRHCGVDPQVAFAVESACSRCGVLSVVHACVGFNEHCIICVEMAWSLYNFTVHAGCVTS